MVLAVSRLTNCILICIYHVLLNTADSKIIYTKLKTTQLWEVGTTFESGINLPFMLKYNKNPSLFCFIKLILFISWVKMFVDTCVTNGTPKYMFHGETYLY